MLKRYTCKYKGDFEFRLTKQIIRDICGIKAKINVMGYCDGYNRRSKADVVLQKDSLEYFCECIDYHDWDNMFYPITLRGKTYLCFRKTLYGFTFLDTETLTEEYDYFPEKVQEGEESYIFVDVKQVGEIIIFNGCYWADRYRYFAYDHSKRCFIDLSKEFDVFADNGESRVENDTLFLTGENKNGESAEVAISNRELCRLTDEKGVPDF